MLKISWRHYESNEYVFKRTGSTRGLINTTNKKKAIRQGHEVRHNSLLRNMKGDWMDNKLNKTREKGRVVMLCMFSALNLQKF